MILNYFLQQKYIFLEEKVNVDNAIKKVPKKYLLNESLMYERVKWRRRAKLEKVLMNFY